MAIKRTGVRFPGWTDRSMPSTAYRVPYRLRRPCARIVVTARWSTHAGAGGEDRSMEPVCPSIGGHAGPTPWGRPIGICRHLDGPACVTGV